MTETTWPKCWRLSSWNLLEISFWSFIMFYYKRFSHKQQGQPHTTQVLFLSNSSVNVILVLNNSSVNKKWILCCILFTIFSVFVQFAHENIAYEATARMFTQFFMIQVNQWFIYFSLSSINSRLHKIHQINDVMVPFIKRVIYVFSESDQIN